MGALPVSCNWTIEAVDKFESWIDVHEPPYMVGHEKTLLEPGMTFTSEPGIYLPGRFGVRIEDDILCTDRGAESLSPRVERLEPIAA